MTDAATLEAGPVSLVLIGIVAFFASLAAARAFMLIGLIPDRPNGRSSHRTVIPRSGGVAIVCAWLAAMALFAFAAPSAAGLALKLSAIVALVFTAGLADDLYDLSAIWKFAAQFAAAGLFLLFFGALGEGPVPIAGQSALGAVGVFLTSLWIVGFMNAYNFMDGVNGLAGGCGLFVLCALTAGAAFFGALPEAAAAAFLALALFGFLPWNFPKGRLFMGDSGSQTVGFLIAALALLIAGRTNGAVSALFAPTAMAPFILDAGFTLAHRAARGRNVLSAHNEHIYQLLVRLGASHVQTTALYVALSAVATTAALAMLRLDPRDQWIAPAALALIFITPAMAVFMRARREGLLPSRATSTRPSPAPAAPETLEPAHESGLRAAE